MDVFHYLFPESDIFLFAPFQSNISFHLPKYTMWAAFQEVGSLEVYTCVASLPSNSFTEMFVYATKSIVLQEHTVCFTSLAIPVQDNSLRVGEFNTAGAHQPVHWFLGGKGLIGIQQGTSVWVGSPKSFNTSVMSFFHLPEMSFILLKCMSSLDISIQPIITLLDVCNFHNKHPWNLETHSLL